MAPNLSRSNTSGLTLSIGCLVMASALVAGCGTGIAPGSGTTPTGHASLNGSVFGGQQPVVGSKVYLYAAGGAMSGSRSMLKAPTYVVTDSGGGFNITGDYTCTAGDQVYVLALGGDAGGGTNNSIGLMAALGPCSALTPSTYIAVNEVTTVASVFALSNYITSPTAVGADPVNSNVVAAAFSDTKSMVNVATGVAPASILGGGVVPQATINSLANSIAACINSTVGSTTCASLFSDTSTPLSSNTVQAMINIAHNPGNQVGAIYDLAGSKPPFVPFLSSAPTSWSAPVVFASDVLTFHNDGYRSGVQPAETTLTPANVTAAKFGKVESFPVDGQLYAQPLFTGGLGMPDGNLHNVVFAATAHGSVYAFDADGLNASAGYLWMKSLFAAGETPILNTDSSCNDTAPEASLLGTPVIDRATGTMYVVTTEDVTASDSFTQKLHAISLIDGTEKFGGPTVITATYAGTGDGAVSGVLTFDALKQNQRPALLLSGGNVWITWASRCDHKNYHGYVMAYSASDVTKQTALYNNTPNGSDGGIWMSGGGPSVDAAGNIYVVGGNGTFDSATNFADATLKLKPPTGNSTTPTLSDYFAPYNQASLSNADKDNGTTEALLFDDPGSVAPHLLVEADKPGTIFVLNTGNLGHYGGTDHVVQEWSLGYWVFNNFTYFNKTLYAGGSGGPLQAFTFTPGTSSAAGQFNTTASSVTTTAPSGQYPTGGSCPEISANGTASAIVWIQEHSGSGGAAPALRAGDATNLATEFYNSNQAASNRDVAPPIVKFSCPIVANGKVFVGGSNSLAVYGLLP